MEGVAMQHNRLTVVRPVRAFARSDWLRIVAGRHFELLEQMPDRFSCQFDSTHSSLPALRRLSRSHPGLIFLLTDETARCLGIAKLQAGRLTHRQVRY